MKKFSLILICILYSIIAICQNKGVRTDELLITSKVSSHSVKLFSDVVTLDDFDIQKRIETLDEFANTEDYSKAYVFKDITFYISANNKISSFETSSSNIAVEKKGTFTISPGDLLDSIKTIFPDETTNGYFSKFRQHQTEYFCVQVPLLGFNNQLQNYVELDCALDLLFDPDSGILKIIYVWIRP